MEDPTGEIAAAWAVKERLRLLLGESDSSGRDHFVFLGTDGEVVSVKWKTMKVHFRYTETDSWTAPLVKPQIPSVYDLFADPGETLNLMDADLTVAWVIRAAMEPLVRRGFPRPTTLRF